MYIAIVIRHRPEETTLYRVVAEELETFLAQVEVHTGSSLPQFVKDELETYLECGILAHGFLPVRCGKCAHEKLVAFSCRRRGFCMAVELMKEDADPRHKAELKDGIAELDALIDEILLGSRLEVA